MLIYMHFGSDASRPGIWLPLFLVWLLLLPLLVLALCLTLLADIVLFVAGQSYHHFTLLLLGAIGLLGATRGTVVHVHADNTDIDIDLV
jgi:hypothetical protein